MAKLLFLSLLVLCFVAPVEQSKAQVPTPTPLPNSPARSHSGRLEDESTRFRSIRFTTQYRKRYLATSSGKLVWEKMAIHEQ